MAENPDLTTLADLIKQLGPLKGVVDGHMFERESAKDTIEAMKAWDDYCKQTELAKNPEKMIRRQRIYTGRGRNC